MLASNNAEPILMLQINRVKPFRLPSVFKVLGPSELLTLWDVSTAITGYLVEQWAHRFLDSIAQ